FTVTPSIAAGGVKTEGISSRRCCSHRSAARHELLHEGIDLSLRRAASQTEPNRASPHLFRDLHRLQHRTEVRGSRVAGGSGGGSDSRHRPQNLGGDVSDEAHIEGIWQPLVKMPVEYDLVAEPILQGFPEAVPERDQLRVIN